MISVRELEQRDLAEVRGLLAQLSEHTSGGARELGEIDIESIFRTMGRAVDLYANWVAVDAQSIVGFLSLIFYKTLFHAGGTALINELVIAKEHRGQGAGRLLVARAVAEARRRGMDEIEVGTEKNNTGARRFYKAVGFTEEYVLVGMEFESEPKTAAETGGTE
jgi:ribosomal protein S18 acetylase RimI-like enzyme